MEKSGMTYEEAQALPVAFPLYPTAARAFGIGRATAYELAARGEFPCRVIRVGRGLRVARADLLRALGESSNGASDGRVRAGDVLDCEHERRAATRAHQFAATPRPDLPSS